MNWKTDLQLRDLDGSQRLEAVCMACGHMHVIDVAMLLRRPELQFIYLDELEKMTMCHARHCHGRVRIALAHTGETEGFMGGLA